MKKNLVFISGALLCIFLALVGYVSWKYYRADYMIVSVEEISSSEYPEDPSTRSAQYSKYGHRSLHLKQIDEDHFDFVFESEDPNVATVAFRNIDIGLFVPTLPKWTKGKEELEIIALVDREWNRQQVSFTPHSQNVEIKGGDGFEQYQTFSLELARNCLNAGLWEVMLYTKENNQKALYYQGWFTFPMGHYKEIFERKNGISYWKHWHRLEHWFDPVGTKVKLASLRTVLSEREVTAEFSPKEKIVVAGEQLRKTRTFDAKDVRCWGDFCSDKSVYYATFIPPGRYSVAHPWSHEYERIAKFEKAILRRIRTPASGEEYDELELVFKSSRTGEPQRFIVSGIQLRKLPTLARNDYPKGLYMPMGIGVPPFYQKYEELEKTPPFLEPFFSLLLDKDGRWINHHEVAIDGPVMHRDLNNPRDVHLYLLSYERHSLVGHFKFPSLMSR